MMYLELAERAKNIIADIETLRNTPNLPDVCFQDTEIMLRIAQVEADRLMMVQEDYLIHGFKREWHLSSELIDPLHSISGFSDIALLGYQNHQCQLRPIQRDLYSSIRAKANTLLYEVRKIQQFSRIQRVKNDPNYRYSPDFHISGIDLTALVSSLEAKTNLHTTFTVNGSGREPFIILSGASLLTDCVKYLSRVFYHLTATPQGNAEIVGMEDSVRLVFTCASNSATQNDIDQLLNDTYAFENLALDLLIAREGILLLGGTFEIALASDMLQTTIQLPRMYNVD